MSDINDSYENPSENANSIPPSVRWLRGLVFALLIASILAMLAVGFAALHLVFRADNFSQPLEGLYDSSMIPSDARLISVSRYGEFILVVYEQNQAIHARQFDKGLNMISEQAYQ